MKRIFILAIASVLATGIQGCSKIKVELAGFTKSTTIPATDFRGIEVHNGIEVEFTDECSEIYVETDANVLPYMEVYESGRVLHIKYADHMDIRGNRWTKLHTFVRIPYRADVRSVSLSGGSTFTSGLPIVSESVSVEASGGSRIYCEHKCRRRCQAYRQKAEFPPQGTPLVYKTNLTNRHEKFLMSEAKVIVLNGFPNFL